MRTGSPPPFKKLLTKTKRNNVAKIRINRLITETQKIPMPPFIWVEDKIEKRTKPDWE